MISHSPIIHDTEFKDDSPANTVERIRRILRENDIEAEERWTDSGIPNCFSIRVNVSGTAMGANGKGVTRELALASGYGELIERIQLGSILGKSDIPDTSVVSGLCMPASELLQRDEGWFSRIADELYRQTGDKLTAEEILAKYTKPDGSVPVYSFYRVGTGTTEYLPVLMCRQLYTSNGCAAGNTTEEALVQAISEIIERRHQTLILTDNIAVPEIPDDILRNYHIAYETIQHLRSKGFRVIVKDCSLGTGFPVVCVCIIELSTGNYHTHFGACPNFEIALQRTLTEIFQGRKIEKVAQHDRFRKDSEDVYDMRYNINEIVFGTAEKRPGFFIDPPQKDCPLPPDITGKNNRELLAKTIDLLHEQGCDILVRDCSCLGFPTYQVIIPGFSEVFLHRLSPKHNDLQYSSCGARVLKNPSAASLDDRLGFLMNLAFKSKRHLPGMSFMREARIAGSLTPAEDAFLLNAACAFVNLSLSRDSEAIRYIDRMLPDAPADDKAYLHCLRRYLSLKTDGRSPEEIRSIITLFHSPDAAERMYTLIAEGINPLEPFTLHCDTQCGPSCRLHSACRKKANADFARSVDKKREAMDDSALKTAFDGIMCRRNEE